LLQEKPEQELYETYAPLKLGEFIEFNTTEFSDKTYSDLLDKIKKSKEGTA
jgi:hypothetical protein